MKSSRWNRTLGRIQYDNRNTSQRNANNTKLASMRMSAIGTIQGQSDSGETSKSTRSSVVAFPFRLSADFRCLCPVAWRLILFGPSDGDDDRIDADDSSPTTSLKSRNLFLHERRNLGPRRCESIAKFQIATRRMIGLDLELKSYHAKRCLSLSEFSFVTREIVIGCVYHFCSVSGPWSSLILWLALVQDHFCKFCTLQVAGRHGNVKGGLSCIQRTITWDDIAFDTQGNCNDCAFSGEPNHWAILPA